MESATKEESFSENKSESKIVYKTISGGLIPSITKNVLQHGIFWIIVYVLGLYNFNWKVSSSANRNYRCLSKVLFHKIAMPSFFDLK